MDIYSLYWTNWMCDLFWFIYVMELFLPPPSSKTRSTGSKQNHNNQLHIGYTKRWKKSKFSLCTMFGLVSNRILSVLKFFFFASTGKLFVARQLPVKRNTLQWICTIRLWFGRWFNETARCLWLQNGSAGYIQTN